MALSSRRAASSANTIAANAGRSSSPLGLMTCGQRDDVERRMAAQIDPALARTRADYTIENDGDREQLRERSRTVYDALVEDLDAKEAP